MKQLVLRLKNLPDLIMIKFARLICSYLVNSNNEHKKTKGVKKNVVATIIHNEYKYVLLSKKCLRHSVNRIQSILF